MKNYFSENKKDLIIITIFIIFAGISYYSGFEFGNSVTTNFKSSFIEAIIGKFILFTVPTEYMTGCDLLHRNALWVYENNKFSEIFHRLTCSNNKLLYLNDDNYPDLIEYCGYDDINLSVLFGSKDGFKDKSELNFECNEYYINDEDARKKSIYGKCGETRINCGNYSDHEFYEYKFNCKKNNLDVVRKTKMKD